jgi:ATP-binding cassette subfamily B protein
MSATTIIPFIYASWRFLNGAISFGAVVMIKESVDRLVGSQAEIIYNLHRVDALCTRMGDLFHILNYPSSLRQSETPLVNPHAVHEIAFHNVSFRYTEDSDYVLKNINIRMGAGEKFAIVGHNGAGKSTLIKLLLRLYDPTKGYISLNGQDIRDYDIHTYRRLYGSIFQNFMLFAAPVHVNVLGASDTSPQGLAVVENALRKAGIFERVMQESKGVYASYTREFDDDGLLLSGGQEQKLALARLVANKDALVYVLDEPSSALDIEAEHHFYSHLSLEAKGKICILISHRLAATIDARQIYFMENAEIRESGSHDELMRMNGRYAEVFNLQAERYRFEAIQKNLAI